MTYYLKTRRYTACFVLLFIFACYPVDSVLFESSPADINKTLKTRSKSEPIDTKKDIRNPKDIKLLIDDNPNKIQRLMAEEFIKSASNLFDTEEWHEDISGNREIYSKSVHAIDSKGKNSLLGDFIVNYVSGNSGNESEPTRNLEELVVLDGKDNELFGRERAVRSLKKDKIMVNKKRSMKKIMSKRAKDLNLLKTHCNLGNRKHKIIKRHLGRVKSSGLHEVSNGQKRKDDGRGESREDEAPEELKQGTNHVPSSKWWSKRAIPGHMSPPPDRYEHFTDPFEATIFQILDCRRGRCKTHCTTCKPASCNEGRTARICFPASHRCLRVTCPCRVTKICVPPRTCCPSCPPPPPTCPGRCLCADLVFPTSCSPEESLDTSHSTLDQGETNSCLSEGKAARDDKPPLTTSLPLKRQISPKSENSSENVDNISVPLDHSKAGIKRADAMHKNHKKRFSASKKLNYPINIKQNANKIKNKAVRKLKLSKGCKRLEREVIRSSNNTSAIEEFITTIPLKQIEFNNKLPGIMKENITSVTFPVESLINKIIDLERRHNIPLDSEIRLDNKHKMPALDEEMDVENFFASGTSEDAEFRRKTCAVRRRSGGPPQDSCKVSAFPKSLFESRTLGCGRRRVREGDCDCHCGCLCHHRSAAIASSSSGLRAPCGCPSVCSCSRGHLGPSAASFLYLNVTR